MESPPSWEPGPPEGEDPSAHPIRVEVSDDLRRSRLTVFLRLLLAIPVALWVLIWSVLVLFAGVFGWFATLVTGRLPAGLHGFMASYVRCVTHLYAYVCLAANPYPDFTGDREYPVDVLIAGPRRQSRWKTLFRLVLAIPALMILFVLVGWPGGGWGETQTAGGTAPQDEQWGGGASTGGIIFMVAFLAWFACLARGRMPQGFRDLVVYCIRYGAQTWSYLLLLTDRYPSADPFEPPPPQPAPARPIRIVIDDDGRRSRLTVLFRLPLAFPHLVWLSLWTVLVYVASFLNWIATLAAGRSPRVFHRFLAAYLRYTVHVYAFLTVVANPFPGFTGAPGRFPIDLEIDGPDRQSRWITLFRGLLALPAWLVALGLLGLLFVAGFLGWFASLVTGRMPLGLRNAGAYAIRYWAQTTGYGLLVLTDRYPYSGPAERRVEDVPEPAPPAWPPVEPEPPWPGPGLASPA